jgi:uncharacterized RDD family membrane protein YckC
MYCVNCGAQVSAADKICAQCGQVVGGGAVTMAAGGAGGVADVYAGFWRRLCAYLIDCFVILVGYIVLSVILVGLPKEVKPLISFLVIVVAQWLYFAIGWSSAAQGTIGKRALGIKVAGLDGNRIGLGRATGRYFAQILTALTLGVGYAMIVFTRRRQALHDVIAGTVVVRREHSAATIAVSTAPEVSPVIAVLAVVALVLLNPMGIGILAAIAIPAYQNYTIRAQVAEGLMLAEPVKTAVATASARGTNWASMTKDSLGIGDVSGKFVSRIEVLRGAIVIEYGNSANKLIAGKTLVLNPYGSASPSGGAGIDWACGRGPSPVGAAPAIEDAARFTTIGNAFLPMMCRG